MFASRPCPDGRLLARAGALSTSWPGLLTARGHVSYLCPILRPPPNLDSADRPAAASDSRNGAAVGGAKEDDTGKGILAQLVQLLEHSTDEVAPPAGLGELFGAVLAALRDQASLPKCSPKDGSAAEGVPLLAYLCFNSSNTEVGR